MGWLITLGILTLLAILPLGVSLKYNGEGPLIRLILGPVRFFLYPVKKKQNKPKKEKKAEKKTPKATESMPEKPEIPPKEEKGEKGGSWKDFLPLVKTVLDFLGDFRRKLRVNYLQLQLTMAADDPCDLAVNYGYTWAAVDNLMTCLEKIFVIKKRGVDVACDFTASETLVIARLDLTITLGRLLVAVARFAFRAIKQFMQIKKSRKGGAKT